MRSGNEWVEAAKLLASDGLGADAFGVSVSLSGDTALIGALLRDTTPDNEEGAAYVFVRSGTIWVEEAKLIASDGEDGDLFGNSVSISGDTALIGALYDDDNGFTSGSAYVFVRYGTVWLEKAKLLASDGANGDVFGFSVSVSGDTALIGAIYDDPRGSAYVFVRNGGTWSETAKLRPSDGSGGSFSSSLSVDGDLALIGAESSYANGSGSGSAYAFVRDGTTWREAARLLAPDGTNQDALGHAVSLAGDTALIGAYRDGPPDNESGSAYVFRLVPSPLAYCTAKVNSLGCAPAIGSAGIPSAAASSGFSVSATDVRNQKVGILLYTLDGRVVAPFQGGWLCLASPIRRTPEASSGGNALPAQDCSGNWSLDMSAFAAGVLGGTPEPALRVPGTTVHCQWWGRDPGALAGSSLTDALQYHVAH